MVTPLECMFDTNIFNRILDGCISLELLAGRVVVHTTHIQLDEINNTKDPARRSALAQVFVDTVGILDPTTTFAWDRSRWDRACWSIEDNLYSEIRAKLDGTNNNKPNNAQDALIAETSIRRGYVLVTEDSDLARVTRQYGGQCLSFEEFLHRCAL